MTEERSWDLTWLALRQRRAFAAASALGAVVCLLLPGPWWTLVGLALPIVTLTRLHRWLCPRCHEPFVGAGLALLRDTCASCALPAFSPLSEVHSRAFSLDGQARTLNPRLRRGLAGAQVVGGVAVGLMAIWYRGAGWMVVGLVSAAILGGVWLWRDEPGGYRLTRLLLALQVVRITWPPVAYSLVLGWHLDLIRRPGSANLSLGAHAQFFVGTVTGPWEVAVNFFALLALLALGGATSRPAPTPPAPPEAA